ncbi:hypothetical protein CBOM_07751 [Ceraceosorus bombacis]|uniref:Uncharacterized protein n=1 Tax=Ceraceosorus bombacis TaxID=401625 RepID=A0A0P1BNN1_9BASI|nr:hypothetical protein CBOM_07751 [Ceraceosorus bombacis]
MRRRKASQLVPTRARLNVGLDSSTEAETRWSLHRQTERSAFLRLPLLSSLHPLTRLVTFASFHMHHHTLFSGAQCPLSFRNSHVQGGATSHPRNSMS